jgi:hypothetical protein
MSELIDARPKGGDSRWQLMATASALALLTSVSMTGASAADDADRASVWVELGGQLERIDGGESVYAPEFVVKNDAAAYNLVSPLSMRAAPRYGFAGEGKLTFAPQGTDFVFTAAARFGRTNGYKERHQQTTTQLLQTNGYAPDNPKYAKFYKPVTRFNHTSQKTSESHLIVDFKAGKDVGLGMFGGRGESTVSLGVRFAQFASRSNTVIRSFPDPYYPRNWKYQTKPHHHSYYAHAQNERSFHGIGPSISWEGDAPLAGNRETGGVTFDWGVNGAVLFGRQKALGATQVSGRYFMGSPFALPPPPTSHYVHSKPFSRSRSKIVPNFGGFAGLSARYSHAKFSFGYRGDFFFGPMDGGLDTRDTRNRSFYGPFATISIGLGG